MSTNQPMNTRAYRIVGLLLSAWNGVFASMFITEPWGIISFFFCALMLGCWFILAAGAATEKAKDELLQAQRDLLKTLGVDLCG